MRRLFAILLLATASGLAQEAPRAVPVDPALERDPGQDWFQHGRNVYESAKRSSGQTQLELYGRASEIFTRYLNDYPRHENAEAAWWYLGQSYYNTGYPEDAKRCFHSLLNRFGKGRYAAAAAYTLAADHFNNRQYALAATLFEKLAQIADKPNDRARGLYYAGKSHELTGRAKHAATFYRKVLDDDNPNNPYRSKAALDYGDILAGEGKLEEALGFLEPLAVSASVDPDTRGEAALIAGSVAAKLGDADKADRFFNIVLSTPGMETHRPAAQIALMAARFDQKRYQDVVDIFRRVPIGTDDPRESQRLMLAARAYMMLDRNADAMPLFREVEKLEPPAAERAFHASYYRLLCFYRIEGRHVLDQVDAFLEIYGKKYGKDPKIHTARLMKAETLYAEGRNEDAADAYREIDPTLLSEKNRRGMLYQRGRCLADASDYEGAIQSLTGFITEFPDDPRADLARAARGRAYSKTGADAAALADFDHIIDHSKDPSLLTIGYLEGAELAKSEGKIDVMVARYQRYLDAGLTSDTAALAKASYWAGWGKVKLNEGASAAPLLERARGLQPERYDKHAGLLLCLVHLAAKDPQALIPEVGTAIEKGYAIDLPEPLIRWAADQAFNGGDFINASRFYDLIADGENPELAPKEVWRFLGKARLRSGDPGGAITAIDHALSAESEPAWKADGLADRAAALLQLKKPDEATKAVEEGLALRPEGRAGAQLHLIRGDILMAEGKPEAAVQSYILPVTLMDDDDKVVKPEALYKLAEALEKSGKTSDAAEYRAQLASKYPDWKPAK